MKIKRSSFSKTFWVCLALLTAVPNLDVQGQQSDYFAVQAGFHSKAQDVPDLVNPEQFRVKPKTSRRLPIFQIGDELPVTGQSPEKPAKVKARDRLADLKDLKEENQMLNLLPVADLNGGIQANSMQRATYNRINLADPNLSYRVGAYLAPPTRSLNCYAITKTWRTPDMAHNPLYFEDSNLERYGNNHGVLQPVYSGIHFFSSVALLPYKAGVSKPRECEYGLGYYRPGDCNPAYRPSLEKSRNGMLRQGLALGAIIGL